MRPLAFLWHVLRGVLLAFAALFVFAEEFGWRPLAALVGRLTRWPPLARLEARIAAASPRTALVMFFLPVLLLLPVKLGALWLIEQGRTGLGLSLIVIAKLIGTAFVGRLFVLVEPQLIQFAWFARGLERWRDVKARTAAALGVSRLWQAARTMRRAGSAWWQRVAARTR